jgi:hypothetical protein
MNSADIKYCDSLIETISCENNPINIRILMTEHGWVSHDDLTDLGWGGKYGYSIWFDRWYWHGVQIYNRTTFHAHTNDLNNVIGAVREAAQLALNAWKEYQDSVPTQLVDNKLVVNGLSTKTFIEERQKLKS